MLIAWYAHHHGRGHLVRAEQLAAAAPGRVVLLSSARPARPELFADWVELPMDDGGRPGTEAVPGLAHYAPIGSAGLAARMARIAAVLADRSPGVVVVDVSVEVALLARLHGVPVVWVRQHGEREDAPHRLALGAAARLVAPWPAWLDAPWAGTDPLATKTSWVGGLSRLGGRTVAPPAGGRRVLVLDGAGGSRGRGTVTAGIGAAGWAVETCGPPASPAEGVVDHGWVEDPWPLLQQADVVVSSAGTNAVADVAAAGRPLVCVPQDRPYDEQRVKAQRLAAAGVATVVEDAAAARWDEVLDCAAAGPTDRLRRLVDPEAPRRLLAVLDDVGRAA